MKSLSVSKERKTATVLVPSQQSSSSVLFLDRWVTFYPGAPSCRYLFRAPPPLFICISKELSTTLRGHCSRRAALPRRGAQQGGRSGGSNASSRISHASSSSDRKLASGDRVDKEARTEPRDTGEKRVPSETATGAGNGGIVNSRGRSADKIFRVHTHIQSSGTADSQLTGTHGIGRCPINVSRLCPPQVKQPAKSQATGRKKLPVA